MNLFQKKHDWILGGFEYLHADDVVANAGIGGATFRTDQLGTGQHVPYTKIMSGTADDTAVIPGDATNGLYVQVKASAAVPVTDNSGSLTVDSAQFPTTLGQTTKAGSMSVTLASNQDALPVTDNSGSLTVDSAQLPAALGQTTMANSMSVALASNQSALPITDNSGSLTVDNAGTFAVQNTTVGSTIPTATTMQNAATANGNGSSLNVSGFAEAILNVVSSVAMSGGTTLNFEASVDDTTWVSIRALTIGTTTYGTTTTADGDYRIAVSGYKSVRCRISAYSAGTITVKGYACAVPARDTVTSLGTGTNTIGALTANQSVNVNQLAGTTTDTNSGNKSAGTLRVVLATDQPTMTNAQPVSQSGTWVSTGSAATDAAVSGNPVYVASRASAAAPTDVSADGDVVPDWNLRSGAKAIQPTFAGVLQSTGNGTAGTGTPRVTIASDNTAFTVNAAQSGTWTVQPGNTANTTAWKVDNSAVNQPTVGAVAHDAVGTSTNPILAGGYASATAPADVSADGDAVRAWHLRNGAAATVITAAGALVGGDATNGLDVDVTRVSGTVTVGGVAAHDAAVSGNPVRIAGQARSSDYTAVANADTADFITDLNGKQIVFPYSIPENLVSGVTAAITGTTDTAVIAAAGAGVRNYVTAITVTNSHATVGTVVELKDGTTVIWRGYAAPAGGGFTLTFPSPLRGTANTAINAANITTGSNTYVSASGFKAP